MVSRKLLIANYVNLICASNWLSWWPQMASMLSLLKTVWFQLIFSQVNLRNPQKDEAEVVAKAHLGKARRVERSRVLLRPLRKAKHQWIFSAPTPWLMDIIFHTTRNSFSISEALVMNLAEKERRRRREERRRRKNSIDRVF